MLALVVCASTAHADPALDKARAAIDASDYLAARSALADALATGDNGPDELAEIYRLTGTIAAGLGDGPAATDAFERMLALAPHATLPAGTSPKITRPFSAAQAFYKTHQPVQIKVDTAASPPSVTITVVADPLHMIASAHAVVRVDGSRDQTLDKHVDASTPTIVLGLPAGRRIDLRVSARDDHGNRLAEVGTADVPLVIVGSAPATTATTATAATPPIAAVQATPPPPHRRSELLAWWLYGGAALGAAAVGSVFGYEVYQAHDQLQSLAAAGKPESDAKAVESRGDRDALISNIAFAAAGALAITTVILYVTHDSREHLAPAPMSGGGGVVWEGRF